MPFKPNNVKTAEEAVEWQQQKAENVKRVETAKRANQRFRPCFPSAFPLLSPSLPLGKKFINKITCRRADSGSLETLRVLTGDSLTPPPSQVENCSNFLSQRALPILLGPS